MKDKTSEQSEEFSVFSKSARREQKAKDESEVEERRRDFDRDPSRALI